MAYSLKEFFVIEVDVAVKFVVLVFLVVITILGVSFLMAVVIFDVDKVLFNSSVVLPVIIAVVV